jgi:hypothetical protein
MYQNQRGGGGPPTFGNTGFSNNAGFNRSQSFQNNNPSGGQNSNGMMCTFCNKAGHTADRCFKNPNAQGQNQQRPPMQCSICNKTGHTAEKCFKNPNSNQQQMGQNQMGQNQMQCPICNKMGHTAEKCFKNPNNSQQQMGQNQMGQNQMQCSICNKSGHTAEKCFQNPNNPRNQQNPMQSSNNPRSMFPNAGDQGNTGQSKFFCTNCNKPGHTADRCFKNPQNVGNMPNQQFNRPTGGFNQNPLSSQVSLSPSPFAQSGSHAFQGSQSNQQFNRPTGGFNQNPQTGQPGLSPSPFAQSGSQNAFQGTQSKFFCEYCQKPGHTADRCRLKDNQSQMGQQNRASGSVEPPTFSAHQPQRTSSLPPGTGFFCTFCNKPGHTADRCFKAQGQQPQTNQMGIQQPQSNQFGGASNQFGAAAPMNQFGGAQTNQYGGNSGACQYCKKTNHASENCRFKPPNATASNTSNQFGNQFGNQMGNQNMSGMRPNNMSSQYGMPCQFCKKSNHTSDKCHFNPNKGQPTTTNSGIAFDPSTLGGNSSVSQQQPVSGNFSNPIGNLNSAAQAQSISNNAVGVNNEKKTHFTEHYKKDLPLLGRELMSDSEISEFLSEMERVLR